MGLVDPQLNRLSNSSSSICSCNCEIVLGPSGELRLKSAIRREDARCRRIQILPPLQEFLERISDGRYMEKT